MNSGRLHHRITFQYKVVTRDVMGGQVITWTNLQAADIPEIWAAAEPLIGREYFTAQQVQSEVEIRFRIRYRDDVNTAWRIVWEGNPYNILEIIDLGGRHIEQHLMATTQKNP